MHRRTLLVQGLAATTLLAACSAPPLVEEAQSAALVIGDITLDMRSFAGITGRNFSVPPEQVSRDVEAALRQVLARPGPANATLSLRLDRVALVSRGQAYVAGQSQVQGQISVRQADTGAVIVPPTDIVGRSENLRVPGLIGVVTTPSAAEDYQQTLRGFAASVHRQLYGVPPAGESA